MPIHVINRNLLPTPSTTLNNKLVPLLHSTTNYIKLVPAIIFEWSWETELPANSGTICR